MNIHPLLERQLRRAALVLDQPPTLDGWGELLQRVNRTYEASDRDRYLTERSLEISSAEMRELYDQLRASSESELASQRDRLQTVVDSIGDGLCVLERGGTVVLANPEAERLLGVPAATLVGRSLWDIVEVRDGGEGRALSPLAGAGAMQGAQRQEDVLFVCHGGRAFPASFVLNPVGAGSATTMVLVFRDISERKRAEEELQRQRDYAAALVNSMQDGLLVISPEGAIAEVSRSFSAMTGFTREELIGSEPPYPYWPHLDRATLERGFERIRAAGFAEWDLDYRRKDGSHLSVILAGSLLRGERGRIVGYLGTVKDVTERKRAESRLALSEARNRGLAAEQAALRRVATVVASETEPQRAFALVAEEVAKLLGVECGLVVRFDRDQASPVGWWGAHQENVTVAFPLRGEGALARVYRTDRPVRVADYRTLDADPVGRIALTASYRSGVAAPVRVGGRTWGAVLAATTLDEPISPNAETRLVLFAELAALAIANAEAREEIERNEQELRAQNAQLAVQRTRLEVALEQLGAEKDRLEAFSRFGDRVAAEIALIPLASAILSGLCAFGGAESGALYAGEAGPDGALPLVAAHGAASTERAERLGPGGQAAGRALRASETVRARAVATGPPRGAVSVEELHVPLIQGSRTLGVVSLARSRTPGFSVSEVAAIEHLCDHAAMALANALSLQRAQRQAEINRSVLETAHDAWVAIDPAGLVTGWNPRSETLFGWTAQEAIGRSLGDLAVPARHRLAYERALAELLAPGQQPLPRRPVELVARRRDGRELPVEVTVSAVPQDAAVGLHAFIRDISDRRRAEQRAAAHHAVSRVLAESPALEEARPRILQALGDRMGWRLGVVWSGSEDGGPVCDALWSAASPVAARSQAVREAVGVALGSGRSAHVLRTGEPVVVEDAGPDELLAPVRSGDAEETIGAICVPITSEGAVLGVIEFLGRDIRSGDAELISMMTAVGAQIGQSFERRRIERETERLKDEFVALVSHELRTPLTSIIGYLEMAIEDEEVSSGQRRWLEVVDRNAKRLLRLVGDLLFIARLEAGQLALETPRPVDLGSVVEQSVQAARPYAEAAGVALTLTREGPGLDCLGDADRLAQVLDNLVSNALKFTPAGGRVEVRLLQREARALIEVSDTGVGIPAAEVKGLFQRFFRASTATRENIAGVGLGLSIAKAIVDAHGGVIDLESVEGEGTTFTVALPLSDADVPLPGPRSEGPNTELTAQGSGSVLSHR